VLHENISAKLVFDICRQTDWMNTPANRQLMVESPPLGGMTERLKVTVLKTVVVQATVGSNPTPSAQGHPTTEYGEVPEWLIGLAC
jgi:hypothetical protein